MIKKTYTFFQGLVRNFASSEQGNRRNNCLLREQIAEVSVGKAEVVTLLFS